MKRSRRVVLTLMGSAAVSGALSARLAMARPATCGPSFEAVPGPIGYPACRAVTHGFGGGFHRFHGDALGHGLGHGHGHVGG
jgi:hypothetical protein